MSAASTNGVNMTPIFEYIEKNSSHYIEKLRQAVAIPSVSATVKDRPHVLAMGKWVEAEMQKLGIDTELRYLGQHLIDGQSVDLPPIVLGSYVRDHSKPTVLIYAHYDVQPAELSDGWDSDPWILNTKDPQGKLIGRGSTDDKGPMLGWLCAIEAYNNLGIELPVNLKFCFEGMEESGSEGLDALIEKEAHGYFSDVDCVCISDNYWLGTTRPCLTYGLRGLCYFSLSVEGPAWDLHSGVFGGTVHEPITDLVHVLSQLVDPHGNILIPGLQASVATLTASEQALYKDLDFCNTTLVQAVGKDVLLHANPTDTLMHRWRYPSLSIHGVEGAFYGSGAKTVIPAKVVGKFSIRLVPNQTPEEVAKLTQAYVEQVFHRLHSKNTCHVQLLSGGKPWVTDPHHWNFRAAQAAVEQVYGVTPDFIREGGSIPVTLTFQECLHKNVCLLAIGRCDDNAHSVNEKLDASNYLNGIKLMAAYFNQISVLPK